MSETNKVCDPHQLTVGGECVKCGAPWSSLTIGQMEDALLITTPAAPVDEEAGFSTECARCGSQPLNYPEPLQSLGEYLTHLLDSDQWAKAERMLHDIGRLLARRPVPSEPTREGLGGTMECPLCGVSEPHYHAPEWAAARRRIHLVLKENWHAATHRPDGTTFTDAEARTVREFMRLMYVDPLSLARRPVGVTEADSIDAARYRALRAGAVLGLTEEGNLCLGVDITGAEEEQDNPTELPMTESNAPFLTEQERSDLNGDRVESKGYVHGDDAIDRAADFVLAALTGGSPR